MICKFFRAWPAILLLAASSCGQSTTNPTIQAAASPPKPALNLHATMSLPQHVKALTNVPFTVSLADSQTGKPVDGQRAVLSLAMPSMSSMPPNVVRLNPVRPGIYSGRGTFTMAGAWKVSAVFLTDDGREWAQSFPVQVK